jgi:PAT family beta-lactamase induction signal transducer AmpG
LARPNLLASSNGRLAAFFALYAGEGLPQGFLVTAVALEFKRMGMEAEAIGTFLAGVTMPWAWKWLAGPIVDNLHLPRFGRRSQWVVAMQIGMLISMAAALSLMPTEAAADGIPVGLAIFTTLMVINAAFSAVQDVAIDALAVTVLSEQERGKANGLMFAGAQFGAALGGSGVLYLKGVLGFGLASLIVPACLLVLLAMMLTMMAEKGLPGVVEPPPAKGLAGAGHQIADYVVTVTRVFFTTRTGLLALVFALLPRGGMAFSLTLSNQVTPSIGMNDDEIASLGLVASVIFIVTCIGGGFVSDWFGRRLTLGLFAGLTVVPTLWMAWVLHQAGWVTTPAAVDGQWPREEELIWAWWWAQVVYTVFQGLMYGISTAIFMDLVEPKIAATQFTACMALMNLVTVYSYWWEGQALTPVATGGWGWTLAQVLVVDSVLGLVFLALLPFCTPREGGAPKLVEAVGAGDRGNPYAAG